MKCQSIGKLELENKLIFHESIPFDPVFEMWTMHFGNMMIVKNTAYT